MPVTIKWKDNSSIETGHRIYKSSTYFTKDNLPTPLVELDANVTEYEDADGTDGENWYIVSSVLNGYEVFSEPFIVGLTTITVHDIFDDGSAIATFNFDGDVVNLSGENNATWEGTETYSAALISDGISLDGSSNVRTAPNMITTYPISISLWCSLASGSNQSDNNIFTISSSDSGDNYIAKIRMNTNGTIELSDNTTNFNSANGEAVIDDDTFHHIVVSIDENNIDLYVDNTLDATISRRGSSIYDISLGANYRGTSPYFNGIIDQCRIFNRGLISEDIDFLYQEGMMFL